MFGFLKKQQDTVTELKAIVNGKTHALDDVPDEIFSSRALGDGIAFEAEDSVIVAPCDCTVVTMSEEMKHALGLKLSNGMEILIHVGVDTVKLQGAGFKQLSREGVQVKAGGPLLQFDKEIIKENGLCDFVIMVITEKGNAGDCRFHIGDVTKGDSVVVRW